MLCIPSVSVSRSLNAKTSLSPSLIINTPPTSLFLLIQSSSAYFSTRFSHLFLLLFFLFYTNSSIGIKLEAMEAIVTLFVMTLAIVLGTTTADPDLLQDVCVADLTSGTHSYPNTFFLVS